MQSSRGLGNHGYGRLQAMHLLTVYMYADSLKLKSVDEASGVLYASKKYMMPHLSCLCREYITNNIRPSNVLSIFEFAESIQETDLFYEPCVEVRYLATGNSFEDLRFSSYIAATTIREIVEETCDALCVCLKDYIKVIIKHTEEVLHLSKGQMSGSFLTTILDQNSLNISELELFETALNWAYLECQEAGFQQTGSNCRAMLDRVGALSKIRFLSLTPEEFSKGPGQSGVLASDEIEALCLALCNIQNKNTSDPNIFDKDWPHSSNEELNCDRNNGNVVLLNTMLKSTLADKSCLPVNISKTLRRHGLSCVMRPRGRISVPQYYCARRFLKTAVTVSGNLRLLTKVHVSRSIVMTGLRFFTRLTPQREFTYSQSFPHDYRENIEVCVLDQLGEPLCNTIFSEKVVYNTLATLTLSEPVRFTGDKEYSIHVILPASTGLTFEYPLSFMSQTERSQDVEFRFCDHADINDNGTFVRRLDMGFLDTIVFSF
uniref:BACK domain-containing protein n=1 Tax=Timema tahoe TaxID=61484 RepID=A0A7R9NY86_9NEOP|nr:unnamed protein product [Timema tahoe]